ncbi:MAG: hypothetical protein U0003_05380 [Vampirovibrionales bacterium]
MALLPQQSSMPSGSLQANLLVSGIRPGQWAVAAWHDVLGRVTVFFRLNKNLQACKVRIGDLQARNERIEQYMAAHQPAHRIDWLR